MKKLITLSLCALSLTTLSAAKTFSIPVGLEVPAGSTITTVTEEDGVSTFNFTGQFAGDPWTEYELYTTETPMIMLNGVTYNLEFDYQCDEPIDDINWMYWPKNGVAQAWCHDKFKAVLPATAGDEWGHASLTFGDRFKYHFGEGIGHVVRLHLRTTNREIGGDKYGQPFSVKIKDVKFVPVQEEVPMATDELPVEIGDVTKSDLDYINKEVNSDGEYTLTWQGNFAGQNGGHYIEYNAYTTEMPHGMLPGVEYKLVFEYKGRALNDFSGLYHLDGIVGDNAGTAAKVNIPDSETDWTTVELSLADRDGRNFWGYPQNSCLRLNFNDASYTSVDGENFGKPLTVQVRNLRFVPVNVAQTADPEVIDLSFTAIALHDGDALQPDGSYDINFTGQFAGEPYTEYEAFISKLEADLVDGELYYLSFDYQADDIINEFVGRYWDDSNQALIIGSTPSKVLPATDQWTQVLLPLSNRADCGWGKTGHSMRVHFYNTARTNKPASSPALRAEGENKYGQPLNVKVRNLRYVPASKIGDIIAGLEEAVINDSVAAEFDGEPEYYTISGQRVANPGQGLYIVRQGSKVSKIIIR